MSENIKQFHIVPRILRPAPKPLGLYLRPGRNDHQGLANFVAAGRAGCFGVVFDPTKVTRHRELLEQVVEHRLDAILDPKTQQSALPGSYTEQLGALPWGRGRPHTIEDFRGARAANMVAAIADFVLRHGFTEVITPSHLLRSAGDEWLEIDVQSAAKLRKRLDQNGGRRVPLIYSLAIPYAVFRNRDQRQKIIDSLGSVQIDAIWLKIDGLGANSTATAARNYIEGAQDFHELGVPVEADHMGGIFGMSLMAFGAVSGISHGITLGERFDARSWRKPLDGTPFSRPPRVYLADLDLMLTREQAEMLLRSGPRARGQLGCRDTSCCPRGVKDLLEHPARHFLTHRIGEVSALSQIPEALRPQQFLDRRLRPATDRAVAATMIEWEDEKMAKKIRENRKRLDSLRVTLGSLAARNAPRTFARLPETRAARDLHATR